jgi:DnaJ-class molecular chaperone
MMQCPSCSGTGWLRKIKPHAYIPTVNVTYTRVCIACGGKGEIPDTAIDNKTKASGGE